MRWREPCENRFSQSFDAALPIACSTTGDTGVKAITLSRLTGGRTISVVVRKMHAVNEIAERPFIINSAAFFRPVRCGNGQCQSTARCESAAHRHALRRTHGDEVVEDAVHDLFIERRRVSEGGEVIFERLGFHATGGRHVFDHDLGVIRLAGYRTDRGKILRVHPHHIATAGMAVWKGLQNFHRWHLRK